MFFLLDSAMGKEYASSEIVKSGEDKTRLSRLFYEIAADVSFIFEDGQQINVNKALLATQSIVFQQMFFGQLREDTHIYIRDSEHRHFRLFLDCLMGFRCPDLNAALVVYPIADKYDARHLKSKCENCFINSDISESVVQILDLGIVYNSKSIIETAVGLIRKKGLEFVFRRTNENYTLTPRSVEKLLNHVKPSEKQFHELILAWASDYIKNNNINSSVRRFLEDTRIWPKMTFENFSIVDLINYYQNKTIRSLYTETERVSHFKEICTKKLDIDVECHLEKIEKGRTVREYFQVNQKTRLDVIECTVYLNGRVPDKERIGEDDKYKEHITCTMAVSYTDIANKKHTCTCTCECNNRIPYSTCIKLKFKEILDGTLIKQIDSIAISYLFHISGVYLRSLPMKAGQIFAVAGELCHTRAVTLLESKQD